MAALVNAQNAAGTGTSLLYRMSAEKLSADELASFRKALAAVKGINDDRGFQYWAGIHGLPLPMHCQHSTSNVNPLFLPWHRAYLYFFELSLQDQVKGVTLPWWDWTSPGSHSSGIPTAYADQRLSDGTDNPLYSSPITAVAWSQAQNEGDALPATPNTVRQPNDPAGLPTTDGSNGDDGIDDILDAPDFLDFSHRLEDVHNAVHAWAGGTMSEIPLAAYDPVFWAHHAMIDRLWDLWQLRHPNIALPAEMLPKALPPFQMTVAQTLNITTLGYDYASFATGVSVGG